MPTYDYRCNACGHTFELFQPMTERPKRKCPRCARSSLERLIGIGAAVVFKGSGFYQTDYRSESYKKSAEADKPASDTKPAADAKPGAKPEAKPETKTPPKSESPGAPTSERAPGSSKEATDKRSSKGRGSRSKGR